MENTSERYVVFLVLLALLPCATFSEAKAQTSPSDQILVAETDYVLDPKQWEEVDQAVDRALRWLANQQQADGSFPTLPTGQPAITSLATMAFLANGYLPGEGPYGAHLKQSIAYVQSTQKRHGLLAVPATNGENIPRKYSHHKGKAVAYNHAISTLMLSEAYAMQGKLDEGESQTIIEKALHASLQMQKWPKSGDQDEGGWRYAHDHGQADSDLSVTGWQLMSLRSAKNAGFEVPKSAIDQAVKFVLRCYRPKYGTFVYFNVPGEDRRSRGISGAGVLALAHAGLHNTEEAKKAGQWILSNGFEQYNQVKRFNQNRWYNDRYHYGIFYCSQAMYQLGGDYWKDFFPAASETLLRNQGANGSWRAEKGDGDDRFGQVYSTALAVLALSAPNQLLPIFQR